MTKIQVIKHLIRMYGDFNDLRGIYTIHRDDVPDESRYIYRDGFKITEWEYNSVRKHGSLTVLTDKYTGYTPEDLRMQAEVNPYTVKPNKPGYVRCAMVKVLEKLKKDTTGYKLKASTLPQLSEQEHKDRHASYLHNSLASKNEVAFKPCGTETQVKGFSPFIHTDYIFAGDFK